MSNIPQVGEKYLVTTDGWFFAPDGELYKAVFGTVHAIRNDEETLGVKTNNKSTNWYLMIGNMIVAGCQIHYAIKTDKVNLNPPIREMEHEGKLIVTDQPNTRIYFAD